MKIKFANVWLAEGSDEILWPGDLANRPTRAVQESLCIGATAPKYFDRGLIKSPISFQVTRRFADVHSCEIWFLSHYQDFPAVGDAEFISADAAGAETSLFLPAAKLEIRQITPKGVSGIVAYTITGGPMARTVGGGGFSTLLPPGPFTTDNPNAVVRPF